MANIALNDAMILPYGANLGRMEFSERTGQKGARGRHVRLYNVSLGGSRSVAVHLRHAKKTKHTRCCGEQRLAEANMKVLPFIPLSVVIVGILFARGSDDASASSLATWALVSVSPSPVLKAGFGCNFVNGQLICGKTKKGDKTTTEDTGSPGGPNTGAAGPNTGAGNPGDQNTGAAGQNTGAANPGGQNTGAAGQNTGAGNPGEPNTGAAHPGEQNTANPGERSCPSGYVVLDQPNKYGAFCEPAKHAYHCLSVLIPGLGTIDCTTSAANEDAAYGYCLKNAQTDFPNVTVPADSLKCSPLE